MKSFDKILQVVNDAMAGLQLEREPDGLYAPVTYTLTLGGKRIRPALSLMACNLFTDDIEPAIHPSLGLEVFHNFTLLHDDIMDKADLRRGNPTVHRRWNENTAILSGDVMQILAYQLIAMTPTAVLKPVIDLFSATAIEVCEGQQYDMEFESRDNVTADEYINMIRLKTAVLLGCSLQTGAIIGGASASDSKHLYDFGIAIGIAFQLKDDLLDVYGNQETFGKKIGGDILCNKKTWLLIHALILANPQQRIELDSWIRRNDGEQEQKIAAVTALYDQIGVREIAESAMNKYYEDALAHLNAVKVAENRKQILYQLAHQLMFRND